jgi:tetratricopeptide (TPR) repeat protein
VAGTRPDGSHVVYGDTQNEKPVINEKFEAYVPPGKSPLKKGPADTSPQDESKSGQDQKTDPLHKGIRLFRMKHGEKALKEFLQASADVAASVDASAPVGASASIDAGADQRTELAYYLGLCCSKLERFDDAVLYLEQVVTAGGDPMRGYQCRMILAYIYIKTGRAKMAEFELSRIQESGFESVLLYNTMAYAAYAQKRYLRAVELYEKALDIDPDNATALNSLGYILADQGLDTVRGLRLCRKAVGKHPESAAYLDSLGWASFKGGRKMEANKWLRRARDIAPHEPEILEHIRIVSREAL